MSAFKSIADNMSKGGKGYQAVIPDGWRQGRTAYGGLTTGLAIEAARRAFPDLPPLRSAQINFVGPVTDDPVFISTLLRQGRNVTSVRTDAVCGDKIVASAIFIFGASRQSDLSQTLSAPSSPDPDTCDSFFTPIMAKFAPGFTQNFDIRLIDGARPISGAEQPYIRCWARHTDKASQTGEASFMTLGDVLPPACMPTFKRTGPVSSVNWHMNILVDDLVTEHGWWQIETRQTATEGGYSSQIMRFWNRAGELAAEGMQSVAIFV